MQSAVKNNTEQKTCWYKNALEQTLAPMTLRVGFLNAKSLEQNAKLIHELTTFIAQKTHLLSQEATAKKIYAPQAATMRIVSSQTLHVETDETITIEHLYVSSMTDKAPIDKSHKNTIGYSKQVIADGAGDEFITTRIVEQSDVVIVNGIGVKDKQLDNYVQKAIAVSATPCFVILRAENSFDFVQVKSSAIEHIDDQSLLFTKLGKEIKEILLFDSLLDETSTDGIEQVEATLNRINEYSLESSLSYQKCSADFEYQGPITSVDSPFRWQNIFKAFVGSLTPKPKHSTTLKNKLNDASKVENNKIDSGEANLSQQKNSDNCHKLFAQFLRADHLAVQYANAHRSSFIIIYWLGAFALINAAIAIGFASIGWLALTSAILEFLALVSIFCVYRNDHKKNYHTKWLEYRSLAEMLRMTPLLNSLGMTLTAEGFERHRRNDDEIVDNHSVGRTWLIIYTESLMRSINFDQVHITQESLLSAKNYLKNTLIKGQVNYHQNNAKKMRVVGHNLGTICFILFVLAFVFVSGKLLTKFFAALNLGIDYQLLSHIGHGLGLLAAICPMLGSAAFAIRNHAEFDISSQRSLAMQKQLKQQEIKLQEMSQPTDYESLVQYTIETSFTLQSETADWLDIYQVKETEPG